MTDSRFIPRRRSRACGRFRDDRTLEQLAKVAATGANLTADAFDECYCSVFDELRIARMAAEKSETFCICDALGSFVVEGIIDAVRFDDEADPYPNDLRIDLELIWKHAKDVPRAISRILEESPLDIAMRVDAAISSLRKGRES